MKESKEKEHRISNLKDMIDTVKDGEDGIDYDDIEEDTELIQYLNDTGSLEDLEIDDEFIYHPDNDDIHAINLDENPIDEELTGDISDSFDNVLNARIGRTPVLGIVSTILGLILIVIGAMIFSSRSDRVIDNVISGENSFITVIFLIIGVLLLIYGIYKVIGMRNPLQGISNSIDSIDHEEIENTENIPKEDQNIIPKSNIPLDKESFKIGEFNFGDLKKSLKKSKSNSEPKTTPSENIDDIPPAREKPDEKKGLTAEEIEEIEYEKVKLENETIDDIFAEVEGIEDIPIISSDSKKEK